jgi:hypothetical protein
VLAEVLPVIERAVSSVPELRQALERAWVALRQPATLQDAFQERQLQELVRGAEQARARLIKAAVLFADGDIDKPGYELLRDKARVDLVAATIELGRPEVVEPCVDLPPLETALAAADGWGAVVRDGDVAAQRKILAALIERIVPMRRGHSGQGAPRDLDVPGRRAAGSSSSFSACRTLSCVAKCLARQGCSRAGKTTLTHQLTRGRSAAEKTQPAGKTTVE